MSDSHKAAQGYPEWALAGWHWLGDAQDKGADHIPPELAADPDYESKSVAGEAVAAAHREQTLTP